MLLSGNSHLDHSQVCGVKLKAKQTHHWLHKQNQPEKKANSKYRCAQERMLILKHNRSTILTNYHAQHVGKHVPRMHILQLQTNNVVDKNASAPL